MSLFVLANWIICLLTSILLSWVIWKKRFLLVKPSVLVIIFFHLRIQWAATISAGQIENYLPEPWVFFLLAQLFPLLGFLVSIFLFRYSAREIWLRLAFPQVLLPYFRFRASLMLAGACLAFAILYLSVVPFTKTGLYTIFTDYSASTLARENSLKLIESPIVSYGYAFTASVFAPLLAVLLAIKAFSCFKKKKLFYVVALLLAILLLLLLVSLSGARGFAASIVFVIFAAWFYRRGTPLKVHYFFGGLLAVLSIPVLLTIWREGVSLNWESFWLYFRGGILWRVFYLPMETGLQHVHYAQTSGYFGIAAIPRLADLFGISALNARNLIGWLYTDTWLQSIVANTSYVFAYYSYFGLLSFVFSLIGLWLLDGALLICRKISDVLLLPCVASLALACTAFTSVDYTIALMSNGFILVLLLSWLTDRLSRINLLRTENN